MTGVSKVLGQIWPSEWSQMACRVARCISMWHRKTKQKNASQLRENKSKNESCMVVFVPHVYDIMFEINNETVQLTVAATD